MNPTLQKFIFTLVGAGLGKEWLPQSKAAP